MTKVREVYGQVFEEALLDELEKEGTVRSVPPHGVLVEIGHTIEHMPLVLSGAIKVMTEDDNGDELLLYFLEFGDTCAMTLSCCTRKAKSNVLAIAEQETEVLMVPVQKMEEWMVKYASWRNFVLSSYHGRLNEMLEAIDGLAFGNMKDRLAKYLRDRAMVLQSADLEITHQKIATDLHSSRVVISRLMKKLELDGVIKQHRNMVQVMEFQG